MLRNNQTAKLELIDLIKDDFEKNSRAERPQKIYLLFIILSKELACEAKQYLHEVIISQQALHELTEKEIGKIYSSN